MTRDDLYYTVWTGATFKAHGRAGDTRFETKPEALAYAQQLRDEGHRSIHVSVALTPKQQLSLSQKEWNPYIEPPLKRCQRCNAVLMGNERRTDTCNACLDRQHRLGGYDPLNIDDAAHLEESPR